jgi:hypothetical protein
MLKQYKINESLIDEIQTHYSNILDEAGLNVADQIAANIGFFNVTGKTIYDPMKVGKTVIFFTRPNLNFHRRKNIEYSRIFSYYKDTPLGCSLMRLLMYPKTANQMYYGKYGDPDNKVMVLGPCDDTDIGGEPIKAGNLSIPIVSSNFSPMFSNVCVESDGGKDIMMEYFDTVGNFSGDKLRYAKGIDETLTIGEFSTTFEDMYSSPVLIAIYLWIMYMHYVGKDLCRPDYSYTIHRIIDYTCSIYIFMLGTDNSTIVRWARYTGCFPINIPFGMIQHTQNIDSTVLSKLSINWAYNFYSPMDPLVLTEFNMISGPSIYERLKSHYNDTDAKLTNELIGYHVLSEKNAARLLNHYYPPYQAGNLESDTVPQRRVDPVKTSTVTNGNSLERVTGYEGMTNGETYNPLLKRRANGLIGNNFQGVPYIVDGNQLLFV